MCINYVPMYCIYVDLEIASKIPRLTQFIMCNKGHPSRAFMYTILNQLIVQNYVTSIKNLRFIGNNWIQVKLNCA